MDVLRHTLHMKCKDGATFAASLLKNTLSCLTMTYALDYKSSTTDWNAPFTAQLPIRVRKERIRRGHISPFKQAYMDEHR